MTVDPSALQAARLALATLTLTWPMLAAAADTTLTRRAVVSVPLTAARAAVRDEQLRLEREDRDNTERYRALPSTRPPADLDVLDIRTLVLQAIHTSVLLARSDLTPWLGRHGLAIATQPPRRVTPHTIGAAIWWLADMLEHTAGAAAAIAQELTPTADRVHQVLQLDPDELWKPLGTARCPVCKQRALYRWTASSDRRAWTRECRALFTDVPVDRSVPCLCRGATCPCGRPGARNGSRHLWPA